MPRLSAIEWMLPVLLLASFASNAANAAEAQQIREKDAAYINGLVHKYGYDRPDAPGMSVIVIKAGKVAFKNAYGLADVEARIPNTTRTNFRLASVTKQFTAMAILILMEQGKLRLESRLTDFFPEFPAYGREITVRQLLNHTSGLPDYGGLIPAGQKEQLKDKDVLRILEQQKDGYFPPGSKYEYSNSGYVVLGLIVAKVSGQSFARFLQANIFQPLGMSDTVAYESGISTVRNRAYGYTFEGDRFRRTDQSLTSATLGDGGIYTSVEDMFRWDQALYTTKLVSASALKQAFTPGKYGNGQTSDYGFGWSIDSVRGFRELSHDGATIGFRTKIVRLPDEKFTIVVLMNRSDGEPGKIANGIARRYLPSLAAPRPPIAKVAPATLNSYTGYYDLRGGVSTITAQAGRLFWAGFGPNPIEFSPLSGDTFFCVNPDINMEGNWRIVFIKDAQGRVKQFVYKVDGREIFVASYLGPLMRTLTPQQDPAPALTQTVEAVLKALAQGGKALAEVANITPGARSDLSNNPILEFAGLRSLSFWADQDVADRAIERHGGKVSRMLYYSFVTDRAAKRYVLIYLTADNRVTDVDVVDD
jgi:CubicO group peptidase (beta-lactamase class C family)